jgi:hypothetical protein
MKTKRDSKQRRNRRLRRLCHGCSRFLPEPFASEIKTCGSCLVTEVAEVSHATKKKVGDNPNKRTCLGLSRSNSKAQLRSANIDSDDDGVDQERTKGVPGDDSSEGPEPMNEAGYSLLRVGTVCCGPSKRLSNWKAQLRSAAMDSDDDQAEDGESKEEFSSDDCSGEHKSSKEHDINVVGVSTMSDDDGLLESLVDTDDDGSEINCETEDDDFCQECWNYH